MDSLTRASGYVMLVMTLGSIAYGLGFVSILWVPAACAVTAAVILWYRTRVVQRVQSILFIFIGLICAGRAVTLSDAEIDIIALASQNHSLIAMLCAVSFLRLIALPSTDDVTAGSGRRGPASFLHTMMGTHLFGAAINFSAVVIVGDRLYKGGRIDRTTATCIARGFSTAALWSPFFVSMATALVYAPGMSLTSVWSLAIPIAILGLGITFAENRWLDPNRLREFRGYPVRLHALWVPALLSALVIAGRWIAPEVSILTLITLLPLLLTLAILLFRHRPPVGIREFHNYVTRRLPDMFGELVLFLSAGVLAVGLRMWVQAGEITLPFAVFDANAAIWMMVVMTGLALAGVHPLVSISAVAVLLEPLNPNPDMLALVFLLAWSIGVAVGPTSVLNLTLQGRYGTRLGDSLVWNAGYLLLMIAIGAGALFIADTLSL